MRIESIRIENFGKLKDFSLDLKRNLNIFKEDNGWGKSTLTAFLRVMFYGFEGEGKHKGYLNERIRFSPWQGGVYGGNIVFETKGRRYRITRQFGAKKSDDIFELRDADTNLISNDFSDEIGRELFHINSDSFMKTVFIGQNDCSSAGSTDDINSRIGNISDSTDMNKYRKADDILTSAVNKLSDRRTGERGKLKDNITMFQTQVHAGAGIEASLDEINERLNRLDEALQNLCEEQKALNEVRTKSQNLSLLIRDKAEYNSLLNEVSEKRKVCEKEKEWFPLDVPTRDRLEVWEKCQDNMNSAKSAAQSVEIKDFEIAELEQLSKYFITNSPDELINAAMLDKAGELAKLRNENIGVSLSKPEADKLSLYRRMFDGCSDPVGDINIVTNNYNKACRLNEQVGIMENELSTLEGKTKSAKMKSRLFMIAEVFVGILFGALGLTTFVPIIKEKIFTDFPSEIVLIIGILLLAIGCCTVLLAIVAGLLNSGRKDEELVSNRRRSVSNTVAEANNLYKGVYSYLTSNRFMNEGGDVQATLQKLLNNAIEYRSLSERYSRFKEQDNSQKCNDIAKHIKEYLRGYGITAEEYDYVAKISYLGATMRRFKQLSIKKEQSDQYRRNSAMSVEEFSEQLKLFGFDTEGDLNILFADIRKHLQMYADASTLLSDAITRLNKFENSHDMDAVKSDIGDNAYISPEEIEEKQKNLDARKEEIENTRKIDLANLDAMEERYEDYLENLRLLDEKREEYIGLTKKYETITKAKEYLSKARENMTSRYVTPLKNGFDKYFSMITNESPDEYSLDANLELTKNEAGMYRDKEYLSYGYRDLLGFCMRLSMADTMYKGEKPMLVLDDPFVNLDDEKMRAAAEMMAGTSEHYQIIYMTCRDDRLGIK